MQIENQKVVSIHYTLTNEAGQVLDSSENQEPLPIFMVTATLSPALRLLWRV